MLKWKYLWSNFFTHEDISVCLSVHLFRFVCVCVCALMILRFTVYIYVCIYTNIYKPTRLWLVSLDGVLLIYIPMHVYYSFCAHTHMHIHTHTHTHIYIYIYIYRNVFVFLQWEGLVYILIQCICVWNWQSVPKSILPERKKLIGINNFSLWNKKNFKNWICRREREKKTHFQP